MGVREPANFVMCPPADNCHLIQFEGHVIYEEIRVFSGRGEISGGSFFEPVESLLPPRLASAKETGFPGVATVAVGLAQDHMLPAQMYACGGAGQ